ncbi:hypothetical protein A3Q56_04566 [Intoshia linei]|uniref:RRM domain-containing protein n=1 Tax=Intoshia linei TaxID=1819745 RepID=A0A177B0D1_9BILA|nr:hypothetical protein A3Q56_04566 [Intoshia linei]
MDKLINKNENNCIYISEMNSDEDTEVIGYQHLFNEFGIFAPRQSIRILSGKSYAFIKYYNYEDAQNAFRYFTKNDYIIDTTIV